MTGDGRMGEIWGMCVVLCNFVYDFIKIICTLLRQLVITVYVNTVLLLLKTKNKTKQKSVPKTQLLHLGRT